ncbi:S1-like domain-containing RNA-binding protein [Helicobacter sp.]|uniref:CvfB family protein n=1 Tax=Helicobacter sp. TaxID=218 RepID=UPI0025C32792|nr:S1-like domain-containing RNA-binding protein [Helicobacter sp.]MCI5633486.1 S1-like domain-containing RNA-binding protein [Helicobacter sp.]
MAFMDIGLCKQLEIVRIAKPGAYLLSGLDEILLPNAYVPKDAKVGDKVAVFLYTDSNDRPVATTLIPKAQRGEIALLKVVDKNNLGCFLDLGIAKDIFMPTKSPEHYKIGSKVAVFLTLDRESRLIAKVNIKPYLDNTHLKGLKIGTKVEIIPFRSTPLGFECVVNGKGLGLLYKNEIFGVFALFETYEAYIKRNDGKCDVSLKHPLRKTALEAESQLLLRVLEQNGGILKLHYDSLPQDIYTQCNLSKKAFKRALSALIKANKVSLKPQDSILLN